MAKAELPSETQKTQETKTSYARLLEQGYICIEKAVSEHDCELLRHWTYQRSHEFVVERRSNARARRRRPEKPHCHVYPEHIAPDSRPAKVGDSVASALKYELPRVDRTDDDEPHLNASLELNSLRMLRVESSDAPWEPTLVEEIPLAIAYLCVQSRLTFRVQRSVGCDTVDVKIGCGDVIVVLTSGYPGEDRVRSVRHGWHTPSERVYLLECRK
jgi:hypothetical protein